MINENTVGVKRESALFSQGIDLGVRIAKKRNKYKDFPFMEYRFV